MNLSELQEHARAARRIIITTASRAGACHIGSSLSPVDILVALYFSVMQIDPETPEDPKRDRCILSKGHGALGMYAVLVRRGYFSEADLDVYGKAGTHLAVHPIYKSAPGIEATSGALGHGLSLGLGMAIAAQRGGDSWKTFVVLSDGECDEGSTWEAAMLAGHLKISHLVAIVDYNKIQSFGNTKDILDLEPFALKWKAVNWNVIEVDGHDMRQLCDALSQARVENEKPTVVIAHTVKGKGVPFMENKLAWHYLNLKPEDLENTLKLVY